MWGQLGSQEGHTEYGALAGRIWSFENTDAHDASTWKVETEDQAVSDLSRLTLGYTVSPDRATQASKYRSPW